MQRDILYNRSTALPHIRGHFHRPRLDQLLTDSLDRQLIVVTAGAGWGKTHAVASFLSGVEARVIWFQLSELDNHVTRFWEEFVYIMAGLNKETAARLEKTGFPETLAKFDQFLHILAKEIYAGEQLVLVFDDFHLIRDESVVRFVKGLVAAKLENFCIIIISRTKLGFTRSFGSNITGRITAEDLCFTPDETEGYLRQNNIHLSAGDLKRVRDFTAGWPLALFLVGVSIKKGGVVSGNPIVGAMPLIFKMIDRELFSGYTPRVQKFLIKASLLSMFPEGLIKVLAGDHLGEISEFFDNSMFVYHNPYTGHYYCHQLFLDFLQGKQENLTPQEMSDTYLTAADWCAGNGLKLEALSYYDKCGCYDEVMNIILNFGAAVFTKSTCDYYIGVIDKFPGEFLKKNPIIHVNRAGLLLNNNEIEPAVQELLETQRELTAAPLTEDGKYVLGNIYFVLGLLSMASCNYDFAGHFKKACEYLPNGGLTDHNGTVVNTKYAIMLNNPAPGELKRMEEALFTAIPCASKAMGGFARGMDYLASAEAAYFTGDMKKAAKNAYEAIYRAREKPVRDVVTNGYFLLMRIEAANGNYQGVVSHLKQLKSFAESAEDKWNFNGMPDIAEGWFNILVGGSESAADWIMDGTDSVLAPYSTGMERMVKARYLLREGKYYELLAWLGQSEGLLRQNNMWLVLLDNLICKAVAFHRIQDKAQTAGALREAYEAAHGNDLNMQFAELGNDMRAVIHAVKNSGRETIPADWLDRIYTKAVTYEKRRSNLKLQHSQALGLDPKPSVNFTKREKEMIRYLCQGFTNAEIATARYISLSAVKKSINSIYIKLGATNRADAVKIAVRLGLDD